MAIHKVTLTVELREALSELNCWRVNENEIERIAALATGNAQAKALRRGHMRAVIAGQKSGSAANRLSHEFRELGQQCAAMLGDTPDSVLHAAAFFHLRFENIHPLVDFNGRVGRLLMAEQIRRVFPIKLEAAFEFFYAAQSDYRAALMASEPAQQLNLMVMFLASVVGVEIGEVQRLPYSLRPKYPDRSPPAVPLKQSPTRPSGLAEVHSFRQRASVAELKMALKVPP